MSKFDKFIRKSDLLQYIKFRIFRIRWRRRNRHNFTTAGNAFHADWVSVGNYTYGSLQVYHFGNEEERLQIGHFCSIGPKCSFLLSGEHNLDRISTYPFQVRLFGAKSESISKGPIVLEDDIWMGYGVVVLSGVRIGQGAVIAAGSVVNKNIPPYAVAGGIPAKVIKYRFDEDFIRELKKIDYAQLTPELIQIHQHELYDKLKTNDQLKWIPKRNN